MLRHPLGLDDLNPRDLYLRQLWGFEDVSRPLLDAGVRLGPIR